MNTFASLGLAPSLVSAVNALGYEEPTPIQKEAIPVLLSGRDLVGQAGTGTGKTAAFALPMIERLIAAGPITKSTKRFPAVQGLVLVPTRELAMQVAEAVHKYAKGSDLTVVPVFGGAPMDQQIRALMRGASIVVATPGRALDHMRRQTLDLSQLQVLVLDEADEMLDMGFAEDLDAILGTTPATRQTALFAATMAPRIAAIANKHLKQPERITIAREKRAAGKMPAIRQVAYIVTRPQKMAAFGRVLEFEDPKSAIVFCRTRVEVDELTDTLKAHGYGAQALHGGMEQKQRDRVMQMFRGGHADMLVATDVAARGLDIDHVSHVFNYDVPNAPEVYVHRIGRTGRAGRDGIAISLVDHRERRQLRSIEQLTKQPIEVLPLPTVGDLRTKRLEATRTALTERIAQGELDGVKIFVQSLAKDYDLVDIAAAAIAMVHDPTAEPEEQEIEPQGPAHAQTRPYERRERSDDRRERGDRPERAPRGDRPERGAPSRRPSAAETGPMTMLRFGIGKKAGVGPGDLVGAIAGESGLKSSILGGIKVSHEYSLVEVPESSAEQIIDALSKATIRGKKVEVRRYKE
ncbi:MAG: DEAD/DEAH box helicase [Acidobacteria bacterium]|nr:DEAD/DEAH box helicase [Acidobacteriota bacterium]